MHNWQIKDLQGVGDVELNLDDSKRVFVLFGSNGVGKTKTLEALYMMLLAKCSVFSKLYQYFPQKPIAQKIIMNKSELLDFCKKGVILSDKSINQVFAQITSKNILATAYLGANLRSTIDKTPNMQVRILGDFKRRQELLFEEIENAIHENKLHHLGMNQNIHQWFIERAQSVNPYQKSDDNLKVDIDTVLKALNTLDNRIEQKLNVDGDGHVFLTIERQERELSELSSGFISVVKIIQSIISFYSAFTNTTDLLNVNGTVFIDEIESHLHVEWQTKIIPTLKNLFPNTTFYIATHSPLVLSQLDEGEAYLLKRDKNGVVRSSVINSPNTRLLENVLQDAFDVDLNQLKRNNMDHIDQSRAKQKLLELLNR